MIATSGDEAFVMFAMFPLKALILTGFLFVIGIVVGYITDTIYDKLHGRQVLELKGFEIHSDDMCLCFPFDNFVSQWKNCTSSRGILSVVTVAIIIGIVFGGFGPEQWNWIRITILFVAVVALFIVVTVPDHFLEEHLWKHVVLKHVPRIFMWTFGVLFVLYFLDEYLNIDLQSVVEKSRWVVLVISALVGIIPESGPHLIFVTLFSKGIIPFSILVTSSIVQDGHGMLPLLADSRKSFFVIKGINFITGLVVGSIMMAFGL